MAPEVFFLVFFPPHLSLSGVKGMPSRSVGRWQYSLINGQLPTSSHNYSFQIIKLGALNVTRQRSDSSNQLRVPCVKTSFYLRRCREVKTITANCQQLNVRLRLFSHAESKDRLLKAFAALWTVPLRILTAPPTDG